MYTLPAGEQQMLNENKLILVYTILKVKEAMCIHNEELLNSSFLVVWGLKWKNVETYSKDAVSKGNKTVL